MRSSRLFYATWKQSARSSSSYSTTTRRSRIAAVMTRSTSSSNGCRATSHWPSSTRSDPPIPMGRLRALEELLELRAVDLGFTENESATFLNEILHLGLPAETLGVAAGTHRRLAGRRSPGGDVAVSRGRSRRLRRTLRRRQPAHRRLLDRGRSRHADRGATPVPARDVGPRHDVRASLRRGHGTAGLRRGLGGARASQPLPDPARRPPGVVSLPRVVRGRAPEPTAPVRSRARPYRAPASFRVARAGGRPVRGRASRSRRRRARERDHVGVGGLAALARAGRCRGNPPAARGASLRRTSSKMRDSPSPGPGR